MLHQSTKLNDLSALFNESEPAAPPAGVRQIPLSQLHPNPYQPRHARYREGLDELVQSVRQYGVLQPILVRQISPHLYEIIAGERRYYAARRAGLESVPAIVKEMTDRESAEVALIENLQREDLRPVEMARAFRALMEDFKLTQRQIAERVGKSRTTITHALRLLQLSDEILDSLDRGEIQEAHAMTLLQVEDEALRKRLFEQVRTEQLSQKAFRQRVRQELGEETPPAPSRSEDRREVRRRQLSVRTETELSAELRQKFARPVEIQCPSLRGGYVTLHFRNPEDMIALVDTLLSVPG